jgi:glycosyltransferase involved in cell wall biosynthesis
VSAAFPRRTKLVLRQANDLTADFALLVQRSVIKHRFARWLSIAALNRADAVVCQSEAMRRDLAHLLGEEQRLLVISNPVDAGRVEHATRARAPKLAGFPSIVSVGRLVPQKGYDVLLHAVAKLRAEHPRMHLTILGEGSERTQLEALIRELAIEDMVTLAGFVAEPLPYVRGADLFALSSRYEGFPNAALEALACGTPVVLTDCPGANSELVRPGRNGELAAAVDPAVFAGALMRAVNNLGTYDRAWISSDCFERYSSARIVREYERVFSA